MKRLGTVVMLIPQLLLATSEYPVLESVSGIPEEHVYKDIDFGQSALSGQRIQIKSDAPNGAPVYSSQLDINNAGIQAGYIIPTSHTVSIGTSCKSADMGEMVQQLVNGVVVTSQLQCMYNPTFCSGGYCFLPVKTSSFIYQFTTLQYSKQCPGGTIVDSVQPSNGIASLNCPVYSGWTLVQGAHGETTNCYKSVTGMSFCSGYQSVCSYKDKSAVLQKVQVLALARLQCTNSTATYTVDNYTP